MASRARLPQLAYVVDPRFPGGTSASVAAEWRVAAALGRFTVHARWAGMFGTARQVAPVLREVLDELCLPLVWDAPGIAADVAILHNPAFLKFLPDFEGWIVARHLVVVAHENFLRPGGIKGFDVGACLDRIDRASLALRKSSTPISPHNRATVTAGSTAGKGRRDVLSEDWFNICEMSCQTPAARPRDRRGRHSRPGFEKFPLLPISIVSFRPMPRPA
ncbi:hypothetical protein [Rhodovulum steppense]|uniref:Uncharacterized protein n=1 Tax=Rhodovulum steppense TaxID=540251 RepID=A0A4R1YV59_9RHOB|nr:hypothetical protein [Rhodovulum steppense]TCM84991.1 hypothetical protein EV216_10976 [Rhodovulum steppense]